MTFARRSSLFILTGLLLACSGGGGEKVFTPDNAHGSPPPAGAQMVSPEEFRQLSQDPDFRWESQVAREARKKKAEEQFQADLVSIQNLVQQRPSLGVFLKEPDLSDPSIKKLSGDNYLITFTNNAGQSESVITMGPRAKLRDLLAAHERFMRVDNQLGLYTEAYDSLPDDLRTGLPTPASLSGKSFAEIRTALAQLEQKLEGQVEALEERALRVTQQRLGLSAQADPYQPPSFPASPANEERSGLGSDRIGGQCDYRAGGLYKNLHWPLKYFTTSTKNQGRRGSCTGFALTSAVETLVAVRDGRWVNLSEQFLYNRIKTVWDADDYDEGAPTADVAEKFSESGYRLPFEDQWNYNPSLKRKGNDAADEEADYIGSCLDYNERCSNTTHQSQFLCTQVGGNYYCGSRPPSNNEGYKISSSYLLWENGDDLPLNTIRNLLAAGRPMVVALEVTRAWHDLNTNGFLWDHRDTVLGGHAIHLVGYLSNSKIQEKLFNAPSGQGGGYFILKNSWGTCYGDGGLIYIPVKWAKNFFKNITVFRASKSNIFKNRPPSISITTPADGASFPYKQSITYSASVTDPDGETPTVTWTSSKDGVLGSGSNLTTEFSSPGLRTITVTARDALGFTASASITVRGTNLPPTAEIISPNTTTALVGQTLVFRGRGLDGDGAFPVELPCSSLTWSSSNSADTLGSGCEFIASFAIAGTRTITLRATDPYGAPGSATRTITVNNPPPSGPPVVTILNPKDNDSFLANSNIRLTYSLTDPGGGPGSQYTVVWRLIYGSQSWTIVPKTCRTASGIPFPCFTPADYGINNYGVKLMQLRLSVTDPENLTGTDQVNISIGLVP